MQIKNTVLVECPVCTGRVASDAKSCPHCGHSLIKSEGKWLHGIGQFFKRTHKIKKLHNNANERCHDQYREYLRASWETIAYLVFSCLVILYLESAVEPCSILSYILSCAFLITFITCVIFAIRMTPAKAKARYNKLKQFSEARAKVFENFDPTAKTVICPVCGEEISVDFIKCPECKLEIGRIIDEVRKAKASR